MRWYIEETKRKIASTNFEGHRDDIEMSGEQVSGIIAYGVKDGVVSFERYLIYPLFRTHPDVTQSSYKVQFDGPVIDFGKEAFEKVELDGVLCVRSRTNELSIVHRFYPSTTCPAFYEIVEITNNSEEDYIPEYKEYRRINTTLCCRGYVYSEIYADIAPRSIKKGETFKVIFSFITRFANSEAVFEENSLEKRYARVKELQDVCDLSSGDDIIDTMFAFAKLRAGESIFKTSAGRVHSPGGTNYYAAIWCNDQSEYSTPWFAFTGDKILNEAAENAQIWFEPYMTDEYRPIPSSIISEATDFWNGAGDRGDASMFLYGNCRYFLTRGIMPDERRMKLLDWCYEYIKRNINSDGVVFSNTDELENRISSGINLNTQSLSYGGLGYYAIILKKQGNTKKANEVLEIRSKLAESIEKYFGGEVSGYTTYHYHKGCDAIRAWNCLPIYMGITDRAEDTLRSIDEKLWNEGSVRSTEGENIMWDRSALYYISALFRVGKTEKAFEKLKEYSQTRLLGDRVPYAVEAYPEYNMRHLSGESALFCRVITDGLLGIDFTENGYRSNCLIPEELESITVENIYLDGEYRTLRFSK